VIKRRVFTGIAALLFGVMAANTAFAQKPGGVLRVFHRDSPASMSILEEGSISAIMPMMGVFNNLFSSTSTCVKTAWNRSCPTSRRAGHGARTGPN
jgi:hypothetical protein